MHSPLCTNALKMLKNVQSAWIFSDSVIICVVTSSGGAITDKNEVIFECKHATNNLARAGCTELYKGGPKIANYIAFPGQLLTGVARRGWRQWRIVWAHLQDPSTAQNGKYLHQ